VFGAWKVTLVNLALLPPLVLVSIMQMRAMGMGAQESQESVAESGKLATEAVMYVIALFLKNAIPWTVSVAAHDKRPCMSLHRICTLRFLVLSPIQYICWWINVGITDPPLKGHCRNQSWETFH
jgi:hypothetical protein